TRRRRRSLAALFGTHESGWVTRHCRNSLSLPSTVSMTWLRTYSVGSPMNRAYAYSVSLVVWSNRVRWRTRRLPRERGLIRAMGNTPSPVRDARRRSASGWHVMRHRNDHVMCARGAAGGRHGCGHELAEPIDTAPGRERPLE